MNKRGSQWPNKQHYLEDMREYRKDLADLRSNKPKLYALILQHLSAEILDAVQKKVQWSSVEQRAHSETLWILVEQKHKVHLISEVEAVVKLAATMQLVTTR